jgi:hypothetical protein
MTKYRIRERSKSMAENCFSKAGATQLIPPPMIIASFPWRR